MLVTPDATLRNPHRDAIVHFLRVARQAHREEDAEVTGVLIVAVDASSGRPLAGGFTDKKACADVVAPASSATRITFMLPVFYW